MPGNEKRTPKVSVNQNASCNADHHLYFTRRLPDSKCSGARPEDHPVGKKRFAGKNFFGAEKTDRIFFFL